MCLKVDTYVSRIIAFPINISIDCFLAGRNGESKHEYNEYLKRYLNVLAKYLYKFVVTAWFSYLSGGDFSTEDLHCCCSLELLKSRARSGYLIWIRPCVYICPREASFLFVTFLNVGLVDLTSKRMYLWPRFRRESERCSQLSLKEAKGARYHLVKDGNPELVRTHHLYVFFVIYT